MKYEKGCLMLDCDIPNWGGLLELVPPEMVYDEEGYGLGKDCHVTVLFGFDPETDPSEVKWACRTYPKIDDIFVTGISLFRNDEFYVLKLDVESETLRLWNRNLRDKFEYENDYPDYSPHITVAYLKPQGDIEGIKLDKPYKVNISGATYSSPQGKIKFDL